MSLPDLESYSESQIQKAVEFSSAFQLYWSLIDHQPEDYSQSLRQKRHQAWLRCVLAELYQSASSKDICQYWSDVALQLLSSACDHITDKMRSEIELSVDISLCLFAYGKLGSEELNLSSDVDLVFICQEESPSNTQILRRFQILMEDVSSWGFCFRTDFDLRPGGRMGPLIPSVEQFMDYYGNYGEAWERLAFVRLRSIWGSTKLIEETVQFAEKFTFRKHLDFALLADLKILRQRIHSQYGHRTSAGQIDLKLGVGGIRDLELFVHTLQIVHGGRDLNFRQRNTTKALENLRDKNILSQEDAQFLISHYWLLRRWENLVQAQADQQTHLLKSDFSLGPPMAKIRKAMEKCDFLVSDLLGKVDVKLKTLPSDSIEQRKWLLELGFSNSSLDQVWEEIIATTALSRQKERDETFRLRFLYLFLTELAKFSSSKDRSLFLLRDFLKATRAKATFYSLFLTKENLIAQIARIFSLSPYLASLLCSRPELIDSFIYRSQGQRENLDSQQLVQSLGENKLLSELINGTDFITFLDLKSLLERMTETADEIATALLKSVQQEMGCELEILALGKWGGRELGLRSDLDFIFVTRDEPSEVQRKAARRFFNRLTGTLQRGGALYPIDLRLKPSGLVVSSFPQLLHFLNNEAEIWERQAYFKSRFLQNLFPRVQILEACQNRPVTLGERASLTHIRNELIKTHPDSAETIDLKYCNGGLVDLEFAIQTSFLLSDVSDFSSSTLEQFERLGWSEAAQCYQFLRKVEQVYQMVVVSSTSKIELKSENFAALAEILGQNEDQFELKLRCALNDSQQLLKRLDPRRRPE